MSALSWAVTGHGKACFSDFLTGARTTFTFDRVLSRYPGYSLLK